MICSRSPYVAWRATRSGISARQGGHHVAQKFTSTTFPRRSVDEIDFPSMSRMATAGAGEGSRNKRSVTFSPAGTACNSDGAAAGSDAADGPDGRVNRAAAQTPPATATGIKTMRAHRLVVIY